MNTILAYFVGGPLNGQTFEIEASMSLYRVREKLLYYPMGDSVPVVDPVVTYERTRFVDRGECEFNIFVPRESANSCTIKLLLEANAKLESILQDVKPLLGEESDHWLSNYEQLDAIQQRRRKVLEKYGTR